MIYKLYVSVTEKKPKCWYVVAWDPRTELEPEPPHDLADDFKELAVARTVWGFMSQLEMFLELEREGHDG